jgi:hypothetical protein
MDKLIKAITLWNKRKDDKIVFGERCNNYFREKY